MSQLPMLLTAADYEDYLAAVIDARAASPVPLSVPTPASLDEEYWDALLNDPHAELDEPLLYEEPADACGETVSSWLNYDARGCGRLVPANELINGLCSFCAEDEAETPDDARRRISTEADHERVYDCWLEERAEQLAEAERDCANMPSDWGL